MIIVSGIRTALMDSPDHKCPACETPGQSPDVLIPNKYLRAMVTSFINETSYVSTKKPPVSAASSSSSAATHPSATTSAARTAVVKTEPLATDSGRWPTGVPAHLMGMQPQTVRVSQVKAEPTSTELMSSRQSQHPVPGSQFNAMSVPGGGHQSAVRNAAGEHGYPPSRPMGRGSAVTHHASPSQIASHNYVQPSAATPLGVSGSTVVQSQSAPSLLSHKQPE